MYRYRVWAASDSITILLLGKTEETGKQAPRQAAMVSPIILSIGRNSG